MDIRKAQRRDRKHNKRANGMQVDGRSAFLSQEIERKKAEDIRKARENKIKLVELPIDN